MKRRLGFIVMMSLVIVFTFGGCSLVSRNQSKYLQEVVATVGNDISITKEDLINGYSSYGSQLVSENNYTVEEAVKATLDALIEREILIKQAKKIVTLSQKDKNEVLISTYDAIISQIETIEEEVREEWNRTKPVTPEVTESEFKPYSEYEATANYIDGNIVKVDNNAAIEQAHYGFSDLASGLNKYWTKSEDDVSTEAFKRYTQTLSKNEAYKKHTDTSDNAVITREIQRIFDIEEENKYLTLLEESYKDNQQITEQQIIDKYLSLRNDDIARYTISDGIGDKNFIDDMLESAKDVYYVKNEKFFYVSHILIPFSDEQTSALKAKEELLNQGAITQNDYDLFKNELAQNITAFARDDKGEQTGSAVSINDIYTEISNGVSSGSFEEKSAKFNSLIYKYNTDPGIMNAEKDYVVGLKDESSEEDTMSKMVPEFTKASRELRTQNELGAISSLVLTDYGYHIIFYTGIAKDFNINTENVKTGCQDLMNTKVNAHSVKTYFHTIYDLIEKTGYETYQAGLINEIKSTEKITTYSYRYNDLIGE